MSIKITRLIKAVQQLAGVADLSVTLDFGGGSVASFTGVSATDMGDYIGDSATSQPVRQKCYLALDPAFPAWRVWFRVDANYSTGNRILQPASNWRDEVVVEYGLSGVANNVPYSVTPVHRLTSYVATVTKGGSTVYQYTVPRHFWHSRWRYQSSQRPVIRTPATCIAKGWIPNFGQNGLFGKGPNATNVTWPGPMGRPGIGIFSPAMDAPGDNSQIGLLTEWAADYVINQTASSLVTSRTEAEWFGNHVGHMRDDTTFAPVDVITGNKNLSNSGGVVSYLAADDATYPEVPQISPAHMYPCANLPWILTEDPYLLEEIQFISNFDVFVGHNQSDILHLPGLTYTGDGQRSFAWSIRDIFLACATSPTSPPSWLRSSAYFKSILDDNKTYALMFVNSPSKLHSIFHSIARIDQTDAWMYSWFSQVVGQAVLMGFSDWLPIYQWAIDFNIQMTNGTSGWRREWPVPYACLPWKTANVNQAVNTAIPDTSKDIEICTSWADFWNYYKTGSLDWKAGTSPLVVNAQTITSLTQIGGIATVVTTANNNYLGTSTNPLANNWFTIQGSTNGYDGPHQIKTISGGASPYTITFNINPATPSPATGSPVLIKMKTDQDGDQIDDTGWDGTTIMASKFSPVRRSYSYFLHLRSTIATAAINGIATASSIYTWLHNQIATTVATDFGVSNFGTARFAVDPVISSLFNLASNTARALPKFNNPIQFPDTDDINQLTSYSSPTYDQIGNQVLFTGAGHGDGFYNGIRRLNLATVTWDDLVSQTDPSLMVYPDNVDPEYTWFTLPIGGEKPVCAHSYKGNVMVGRKFFHMVTTLQCNKPIATMGTMPTGLGHAWWYDLDTSTFNKSQYRLAGSQGTLSPWGQDNLAACTDPVSQRVFMVAGYGANHGGSGFTSYYVYKPDQDLVTNNGTNSAVFMGSPGTVVYSTSESTGNNAIFYYIGTHAIVYKFTMNRTTLSVTPTGQVGLANPTIANVPNGQYGFAYDTVNNLIGGFVSNGSMYFFNPADATWSSRTMLTEAGTTTPNQSYYNIVFDQGSGCYIICAAGGWTWAYRY